MSSEKEVLFQSANGKDTIAAVLYPVENPVGIVQLCHGMTEHIARYRWLAGRLNAAGFLVCGHDHLGHGKSAASEEDLGFFHSCDGYRYLVQDVHQLRQKVQEEFPGLPYFLLGHSMGSFITRLYLTEYGKGLAGYLCCGTSGTNPQVKLGIGLATLLIALKGERYRSERLHRLSNRGYNARFEGDSGNEWLSRDPAVGEAYAKDPFCTFAFTNSAYRDLFRLLDRVSTQEWYDAVPKDLPVILMSGAMDPVGNYGKGVREVHRRLCAAGVKDVQMKLYPECRHELHNELNKEEVVQDMVRWLESHL